MRSITTSVAQFTIACKERKGSKNINKTNDTPKISNTTDKNNGSKNKGISSEPNMPTNEELSHVADQSIIEPESIVDNNQTELKDELIDINKITAEMIVNWKNEYVLLCDNNETLTVNSDELGSLENNIIKHLLTENLRSIFIAKLTGIDETKVKSNDMGMKLNEVLNDEEIKNIQIYNFLVKESLINWKIEVENEQNGKKIITTVKKADWKEDQLKLSLNESIEGSKNIVN